MQGAEEYDKTEMEKQATKLASSSTATEVTPAKDRNVDGKRSLLPPFKSATEAKAEAEAKEQADADTLHAETEIYPSQDNVTKKQAALDPATLKANETTVKKHERKLQQRTKVWAQADAAVDTDSFIQATTQAFETHTNSKLITNAIADLTRQLHQLTLVVSSYQAKASKFKDLPTWIPMSCKSGFSLSAPQDIPDDDPGLEALRENVADIRKTYETALAQCVRKRELLLLKRALHRRRELFVSSSLDIATNWLCLWLPKNQKLLRRDPLTIKEDQVVGIIFERLLTIGCYELRNDLDNFFNEDLKFHFMLAAKLRAQPRFRSAEAPEKRIFRNREEADANGMYPFTKVTWDHTEYDKLEAATRIIEKPLTSFLELLCKETTFKFQQDYEDELNYRLAELQVKARVKKAAALSAAAATATALENAKKATPESVQNTIAKLNTKMTQLQRTQQRQGGKRTPPKSPANEPPAQKNMRGGRADKRRSVTPKATGKDNRRGSDKRQRPSPSGQRKKQRTTKETLQQDTPTQSTTPPSQKKQKRQQSRRPKQVKWRQQQAQNGKDSPAASKDAARETADKES
jgi:hypothetical protein